MDPIEKAKAQMGGIEKAISGLPGIKGYREKEMRRDADKQLRDALARRLESRRRKLTALQSDLLASGGLLWLDDVERVVGRLQLLHRSHQDRVLRLRAAASTLNKVKEADLDRLLQFDQSLLRRARQFGRGHRQPGTGREGKRRHQGRVWSPSATLVSGLNETFNRRIEVIQNAAE